MAYGKYILSVLDKKQPLKNKRFFEGTKSLKTQVLATKK
jgi:hypothetical protein